jgi:hypothetical protein
MTRAMATKKKRASFGSRLLDLILPPKKKKKKRPQRADPQSRAVARHGLARLKAQNQLQQGQRAADVLSAVGGPLAALEAALGVIDTLQALIREADELVGAARESDIARRALLSERYDDIRFELERIVKDSSEGGLALIGHSGKSINVTAGGGKKAVSIRPINLESGPDGLGLPPPETGFAENEELDLVERRLSVISGRIARAAETFVANAALLSNSLLGGTTPPSGEPGRNNSLLTRR